MQPFKNVPLLIKFPKYFISFFCMSTVFIEYLTVWNIGVLEYKRDQASRHFRKLYDDVVRDIYRSPNIVWIPKSKRLRWAGNEKFGKWGMHTEFWRRSSLRKLPLETPKMLWENNINVDLQEVCLATGVCWTDQKCVRWRISGVETWVLLSER
jgi:hypothetical protein